MKDLSDCRPGLLLLILVLALFLAPASPPPLASEGPAPELACPTPCDDQNGCTIDSCDTTTGTCRYDPVNCDDGKVCTTDFCTPGQFSVCQHTALPLLTPCNDGNSCTTGELCNGSQVCQGILLASGSPCDDSNPCTHSDTCSASGSCGGTLMFAGDPCDDGSLCTTGETCIELIGGNLGCVGTQAPCNDSDACTQDTCEASTGACVHTPVNCDDGNPCTGDNCDPSTGSCFRTMVSGPCSDGDVCTDPDSCSGGNCVGPPRNCNDGIACTGDSCSPGFGGCNHMPNYTLCDDNNVCTSDFCDATFGCWHQNLTGTPCTPANKCLLPFCRNGTCGSIAPFTCNDNNACTFDGCNPSNGECVFTPISCDDQNSCTSDSCSPQTGCIHDPLSQTPVIAISQVVPQILKPTNHKLVPVNVVVSAQADCGPLPAILTSVTSSQADDAPGPSDGHTVGDIQDAQLGTPDTSFFLRAEFDRSLGSRTYTIVYTAFTSDGSSASASATVTVPASGPNKPQPKVDPREGTDKEPGKKKPGMGK